MQERRQEDLSINSRGAKQGLLCALDSVLENAGQIITICNDQQYHTFIGEASIGKHIRHLLEFFQSLEIGIVTGMINHDARARNSDYETHRFNAFQALSESIQNIKEKIHTVELDQVVNFLQTPNIGGPRIIFPTTIGREMMTACDHATHHFAIIKTMADQLGIKLASNFGVSVATIKNNRLTSAPS
jgi:hypothetical protein